MHHDVEEAAARLFMAIEGSGQAVWESWHPPLMDRKGGPPVIGYILKTRDGETGEARKDYFVTQAGMATILQGFDIAPVLNGLGDLGAIVRREVIAGNRVRTVLAVPIWVPSESMLVTLYQVDRGACAGLVLAEVE
jgi:hypothetical protein